MLKTTSVVKPAASTEVGDGEQDSKGVQVENRVKQEPAQRAQKSRKGQRTAKSKK